MKQRRQATTLLIAILLSLLAGQLSAAVPSLRFLPIIANGQPNAQTALIYECQCGAVLATPRADGTVLLTILDHSRGGLIVVGYDDGVAFHEIENTPMAPTFPIRPAIEFPGEKQGIGDTVEVWSKLITYAPSRTEEGGRYNIWRFVYTQTTRG